MKAMLGARGLACLGGYGQTRSQVAVWAAIVVVLAVAGVCAPGFLTANHLLDVARQVASLAIVTVGQVFVITAGGIDLSNGMVMTLITVVAADLLHGQNTYTVPVVLLCLGIGLAVGLFNGFLVTKLRIQPLIGTLGTYGILQGTAYVYCAGAPKGSISPSLKTLGNGYALGIPLPVILALVIVVLGYLVLNRTTFGRALFATGANPRTARLSGIAIDRTIILAYVVSGLTAAAAGLVVAGYIGIGSLSAGNDFNLNSVAAAVIGGTTLVGGIGSVSGGAAAALFLGLLVSLLRFLGLSYSTQLIVQGGILAAAVLAQSRATRGGGL
jgi:ribose transport system permease protein